MTAHDLRTGRANPGDPPVVWLLDDRDEPRESLARLLDLDGLGTRQFERPAAVLETVRDGPAPIDCLVLRVGLCDGPLHDFVHELRVHRPGVPIVHLSERDPGWLREHGFVQAHEPVLQEPFREGRALELVRWVLTAAPPHPAPV